LAALDQWIARQSDMPSRPEAVRRLLVLGLTVEQNVAEIVACGRTRWKIENEGFNVMKNHATSSNTISAMARDSWR
jgi:hypothetical protein